MRSFFFLGQWSSVCPRQNFQTRREIVSVSAIIVTVKVSVSEPSNADNAEMATQTEGRPELALCLVAVAYRWAGLGGSIPPPPEITKVLQNHAKLNAIVKTVKNC